MHVEVSQLSFNDTHIGRILHEIYLYFPQCHVSMATHTTGPNAPTPKRQKPCRPFLTLVQDPTRILLYVTIVPTGGGWLRSGDRRARPERFHGEYLISSYFGVGHWYIKQLDAAWMRDSCPGSTVEG